MRRLLMFIVICSLFGCSRSEINSGIYKTAKTNELTILTLDEENKTFVFSYDPLSSYLPCGTYTIKGNVLIATTQDNDYQYVFDIVDDSTLQIRVQDSTMKCHDDRYCGIPQESQQFFLQE